MKEKLTKVLAGNADCHVLPFFWQHGEDDETLLEELHRIKESGSRAFCAESRPHEEFVRDGWWEDMTLLLEEARRLDMEMWILDDKYFPTGFCNGVIRDRRPELGKKAVTEKHVDVCGPVTDGAVIYEGWADEEKGDELLGIVACRCGEDQTLTGECLDFTDRLRDGLVSVDLPDGIWRIFFIFVRPKVDGRVDFTNPESVDMMFEEIYEPHYEHLGKYFGNTFRGFFSDEPFILDRSALPRLDECKPHAEYPWNKYILAEMKEKYGKDWLCHMPSLWFTVKGVSPAYRVAYMDTVSSLYKKHFSGRVGDWCRAHGVEYIGHVLEDYDQHSNMNSGGHYFRALDGQDMAGIDVVLHQIVPGMQYHPNSCNCWYDVADPDLFNFSLGKMASSHAHIQKSKKGRALCEIYGAYGWAEGVKMMKWLSDHMLVRGINNFVPHAFSAKFPDEVPPQFTGAGHNPQEKQFRRIIEYLDRVSTIFSDGVHHADCAVLYHAEAEWAGGDYMPFYVPARLLTEDHIDFDLISCDYLEEAGLDGGCLTLGDEKYPCIIVPRSKYLPKAALTALNNAANAGVDVVFLDKLTHRACDEAGVRFDFDSKTHVHVVPSEYLTFWMRGHNYFDLTSSTEAKDLRFYHYEKNGTHAYMLTNEGIVDTILTSLTFDEFDGGDFGVWFPMENKAYLAHNNGRAIKVRLEPYESVVVFFGELPEGLPEFSLFETKERTVVTPEFDVSLYTAENYPEKPSDTLHLTELKNITSPDMFPRFGGYMTYEGSFDFDASKSGRYVIDLGRVGETAEVWLNGENIGEKIAPPYRFDATGILKNGKNELKVVVTNHLGYEQRDLCSKYLLMEASGLLGPIEVKYSEKINEKN